MTRAVAFGKGQGVGASQVSALYGRSPWMTEAALWMEKVGLSTGRAQTGPMTAGLALEPVVLDLGAASTGRRITRNRMTWPHPDWPRTPMYATPDGFTRGRWGVVEAKVVGRLWTDWADGPPRYVQDQVQAQMACYPRATFALVVALLGTDVRTHEIPRDQEAIEALEADVRAWWRTHVVGEVAPPAETADDRWAMARVLAARAIDRGPRVASGEEEVLGARLAALMAQADVIEAEAEEVRLALAEMTADDDLAGATWRATWSERKHTDWKTIAQAAGAPPYLVEAHTTARPVFTFRRTKAQEEPAA